MVTVLGLGTPMLSATIAKFIGTEPTLGLDITVVGIWTVMFCTTTLDSASYVLVTVSTKKLPMGQKPAKWNRMFWSVINGVAAVSLMLGKIKVLNFPNIILFFEVNLSFVLLMC